MRTLPTSGEAPLIFWARIDGATRLQLRATVHFDGGLFWLRNLPKVQWEGRETNVEKINGLLDPKFIQPSPQEPQTYIYADEIALYKIADETSHS